jgi:hypothetical protein
MKVIEKLLKNGVDLGLVTIVTILEGDLGLRLS